MLFRSSDIVSEGLRVHEPRLDKETVRQRVAEVLRQVGLPEDASERYPHEFSGGQRQRLAVARALIVKPSVLVLDEPTSALDVQWQRQILKLLADLQRKYGLSMVIVSHDLAVINALSHRVMVTIDFPAAQEQRIYAVQSAPLSRVQFRLGDQVQHIEGWHGEVTNVAENKC